MLSEETRAGLASRRVPAPVADRGGGRRPGSPSSSGETGHAWVVQPGRPPLDFRFPRVPGPRTADDKPVGAPPSSPPERLYENDPAVAVAERPQDLPRDDHAVHLVGAVVDPRRAGVERTSCASGVSSVSAAGAVDLDGAVDHVAEHVARA